MRGKVRARVTLGFLTDKRGSFALKEIQTIDMKSARRAPAFSKVFLLVFGLIIGVGVGQFVDVRAALPTNETLKTTNAGLPEDLDYTSVEEVYDKLRADYDGELNADDILSGIKHGLAEAAGDPYTTYFTADENEEFNGDVNGTFVGIGAELSTENNLVIIATPLAGFPAEKAGVKARDIILKIDGEDATQLSVADAVKKIRGEKGTTVKLTLLRDKQQIEVEIVRDTITIPSVNSKVEGGIGYLQISRFGNDTALLAQQAAESFKAQGVTGIIVDVRNNPGGYLDQAVKVASLWVDKGKTVVDERRNNVSIRTDKAIGGNILSGIPTIVLMNGGSASASEILAGALKDNGAATLYGEKTFGKGSVQQVEQFEDSSALKVTVARWYTPSGKNINKEGISPDVEVKVSDDDAKAGNDTQKAAATKALQP